MLQNTTCTYYFVVWTQISLEQIGEKTISDWLIQIIDMRNSYLGFLQTQLSITVLSAKVGIRNDDNRGFNVGAN